ncbi:MAG: alpha-amylase family glycosyl hydrolase [Rhodobacteraceae bacterium]|nr:alpha-amylase family glycosyl hydrolase [Paracoccaceae bacterium]
MDSEGRSRRTGKFVNGSESHWWRGAVVYQVYPRSFQDSNDDGIGDLKGIRSRLQYIADLGVDAVWISPFFRSPMKDFGYDVADYLDVDPRFGTLDDFKELLATCHEMDIRVLIDLVISHTSDRHEWFVESRSSRTNRRADWYVWADAKPDGTPPNNWLSVFGGPAWTWDSMRGQYYLHNFLRSQPDLNFHSPEVRKQALDVADFWLDLGVDGFRLDTVNFYFCDSELRDNPVVSKEHRNSSIAPSVNPYNMQSHVHSKNRPENLQFLEEFRQLLDRYENRTSIGEVGDAQKGLAISAEYTKGESRLHSCYSFELLSGDTISARRLAEVISRFEEIAPDGWACWAFSNHDVVRHATRWQLDRKQQELLIMALVCLRGPVCVFQGEELGLAQANLDFDAIRDPYGKEFWPEYTGRDGCRTPMVWSADERHGGFSNADPWLPVPAEHLPLSVKESEHDASSLLHAYRRAIRMRRRFTELRSGTLERVRAEENALTFLRRTGSTALYCAFNLQDTPTIVTMPSGNWLSVEGSGGNDGARHLQGSCRLEEWGTLVARSN